MAAGIVYDRLVSRRALAAALGILAAYWCARLVILKFIPVFPSQAQFRSWAAERQAEAGGAALTWYRADGNGWLAARRASGAPACRTDIRIQDRDVSAEELVTMLDQLEAAERKQGKGAWKPLIANALQAMDHVSERCAGLGGPYAEWEKVVAPHVQQRVTDWRGKQWYRWDRAMALPRLVAFILCLWLASRLAPLKDGGWHLGLPPVPAAWLAAATAGYFLILASQSHPPPPTSAAAAFALANTALVGLWEEAMFRGLLFASLALQSRGFKAGLWSSLLFVVYHVPLYSLNAAPPQFLFGLAACAGVAGGVGLPWLVLVHFLIDAFVVLAPEPFLGPALAVGGLAVMAGAAFLPWLRRSAVAAPAAA